MSNTTEVAYSKLTNHRGNKRIWLEGKRLGTIGFVRHATYDTIINKETKTLVLILSDNGTKKVSGRKRGEKEIPILDIGNVEITDMFKDIERIRATFKTTGVIVIEPHHEDANMVEREARLKKNLKGGTVTEGSACSGAGVFAAASHEGLLEGDIHSQVSWVVDREGKYLQVGMDNNSAITDDTVIFEATLEELEPELLSPVDIFEFSLACTGHGNAGKAKNKIGKAEEHPTDATSVFGVMNMIKSSNPAIIRSENVVEAQNSATYMLIKAELQRLGYTVYEAILDQVQAGSFEKRKRYWFMAVSKGIDDMANMGLDDLNQYAKRYENLGQVLELVPADSPMWAENQYLKDKAVTDKAAGKGFSRQLLTEDADSCGTIGRHYNKRRSTEPFVTREDGKERLLTPVEHCRVKGIPESMVEGVSTTTAHEILGQAGLWNNAKAIGLRIAEILTIVKQQEFA